MNNCLDDPAQLFLDSDEQSGIAAGTKWEQVLYERLKDCRALVVLCTPNWKASQWCFAELVYAKIATGFRAPQHLFAEIANKAMFHCWEPLKDWIQTPADILRWRRDVTRTREFALHANKRWWGLNREQLALARNWRKHRRDELTPDESSWINSGIFWERAWRGLVTAVVLVISAFTCVALSEKTRRKLSTSMQNAIRHQQSLLS